MSFTAIDLPSGWSLKPLKYLVDPRRRITYGIVQCGPHVDDGVPYIRPVDMTDDGGVGATPLQRTTPEIAAAYTRSIVRSGDLVVSIGPSFGKVMIVPPELAGANLTQGTARVACSRDVIPRYLFWLLRSSFAHAQWKAGSSGATFTALTLELLADTKCPTPPKVEQEAIARYLDVETSKIDALIEKVAGSKWRASVDVRSVGGMLGMLLERRAALITTAITGQVRIEAATEAAA